MSEQVERTHGDIEAAARSLVDFTTDRSLPREGLRDPYQFKGSAAAQLRQLVEHAEQTAYAWKNPGDPLLLDALTGITLMTAGVPLLLGTIGVVEGAWGQGVPILFVGLVSIPLHWWLRRKRNAERARRSAAADPAHVQTALTPLVLLADELAPGREVAVRLDTSTPTSLEPVALDRQQVGNKEKVKAHYRHENWLRMTLPLANGVTTELLATTDVKLARKTKYKSKGRSRVDDQRRMVDELTVSFTGTKAIAMRPDAQARVQAGLAAVGLPDARARLRKATLSITFKLGPVDYKHGLYELRNEPPNLMELLNGPVLMQHLQVAHRLFVEGALVAVPQAGASAKPSAGQPLVPGAVAPVPT